MLEIEDMPNSCLCILLQQQEMPSNLEVLDTGREEVEMMRFNIFEDGCTNHVCQSRREVEKDVNVGIRFLVLEEACHSYSPALRGPLRGNCHVCTSLTIKKLEKNSMETLLF